jgi:hypothetical protein
MESESRACVSELNGEELSDLLINNGILQEVNRTFFNPIGLQMNIIDNQIQMLKTDDPKGFLIERINKFHIDAFRKYSKQRHDQRGTLLGFLIQYHDLYRAATLAVGVGLSILPSQSKINAIFKVLNLFGYLMSQKVMKHHKALDNNFDAMQFNEMKLHNQLINHVVERDWVGVGCIAAMLHEKEYLTNAVKRCQKMVVQQQIEEGE